LTSNNDTQISSTHNNNSCSFGFYQDIDGSCQQCGKTKYEQNLKIVGGITATAHSWPATALIIFQYKGDVRLSNGDTYYVEKKYMCGGTLIDRRTILSAAHCIPQTIQIKVNDITYEVIVGPTNYYPTIASMYTIYLGLEDQTKINDGNISPPAVKMSVQRLIKHELYNSDALLNDISLMILDKPVVLSDSIQPACLPNQNLNEYPPDNVDAWAVGWGTLKFGGESPQKLQNVKLQVYNGSMCMRVSYDVKKDWQRQICAGYYDGGKDTCQGDSGGSLYTRDIVLNQIKYISSGIVSYGDGCADKYLPG
jgi:acrosin